MDHSKRLPGLAVASALGAFTLPAVPGYPRWPSPIAQTHGDDRAPRVTKRGPGRRHISGRREVASLGAYREPKVGRIGVRGLT